MGEGLIPYKVEVSQELIVAISQYYSVEYTVRALEKLKEENIPFTTLILFDGTPILDFGPIQSYARRLLNETDVSVCIKKRINSLPHIWNIMFGVAKLTKAKYLFWQGSDMEIKKGSLRSMYESIKKYDVINPVKIDEDKKRFDEYQPISSNLIKCAGINDSAAMFRLDKMPFFPFDEAYAPYQFETSALGYELWRKGCSMAIDSNAVIFHHCSKDIEHSPKERKIGSENWDKKRDYFKKNADADKLWFLQESILNSEIVKEFGFPVYIYPEEE